MKYDFTHFTDELSKIKCTLNNSQLEQFELYYDMLIEKNKVMNLTAITDFDEVIEKHFLDLKDIEAVHGRAEDFARDKEHRASYDICVSRAVANLSTLSEYCLPFVKMGGCFVSYKSGECESEVADAKSAIYLLGGKLNKIEQFGYSDNHRSFVIIDKVMNTSNKYPRKAGLPSKKPL